MPDVIREQVREVQFVNELGRTITLSVERNAESVTIIGTGPDSRVEHTWTPREADHIVALLAGEGTAQPDPPAYDPGREHLTLAEIEGLDHHGHWDVEEIETLIRTTKALAGYLRASGEGTAPPRRKWPHRDDEELREKLATAQRQGFTALATEIETELAERGTAPQVPAEPDEVDEHGNVVFFGTDAGYRAVAWLTQPQALWEGPAEELEELMPSVGTEMALGVEPTARVRVVAADGAPTVEPPLCPGSGQAVDRAPFEHMGPQGFCPECEQVVDVDDETLEEHPASGSQADG